MKICKFTNVHVDSFVSLILLSELGNKKVCILPNLIRP